MLEDKDLHGSPMVLLAVPWRPFILAKLKIYLDRLKCGAALVRNRSIVLTPTFVL